LSAKTLREQLNLFSFSSSRLPYLLSLLKEIILYFYSSSIFLFKNKSLKLQNNLS